MKMRRVAVVITLAWAVFGCLGFADKGISTTAIKALRIAPGDTKYSAPIKWGGTAFQAMDWQVATVSGDPSVRVMVLQSNSPDGPFTQWSDPIDGIGSVTNGVTITTTAGGTPWRCTPSDWAMYAATNMAAATATVTVRDYSK